MPARAHSPTPNPISPIPTLCVLPISVSSVSALRARPIPRRDRCRILSHFVSNRSHFGCTSSLFVAPRLNTNPVFSPPAG
jgi:hypothetical protein